MINGAQASNVFFKVGSSATLGSTTAIQGDIVALSSITLDDIECGAALAQANIDKTQADDERARSMPGTFLRRGSSHAAAFGGQTN